MRVEIINHDHLTVEADLDVLPRIGESFICSTKDGFKFSGTVRDIEHSYNASKGNHSIIVYLKP